MRDTNTLEELQLSDAELIEVLKTHGINRRTLVKGLGIGGAAALFGSGTALAGGDDHGPAQATRIHPYLGYTELPDSIDPTTFPREPDHTVEVMIHLPPAEECGPFHFEPAGLHVEPGDIVRWEGDSAFEITDDGPTGEIAGDHTISAYTPLVGRQRRIPADATPFSSPMMGIDVSWYYRFDEPGVYDIYCGPHEEFGMVMRVVVGDVTELDFGAGYDPEMPPGESNPPLFNEVGPLGAAGPVFENLDPETILEQGSIEWHQASLCPE